MIGVPTPELRATGNPVSTVGLTDAGLGAGFDGGAEAVLAETVFAGGVTACVRASPVPTGGTGFAAVRITGGDDFFSVLLSAVAVVEEEEEVEEAVAADAAATDDAPLVEAVAVVLDLFLWADLWTTGVPSGATGVCAGGVVGAGAEMTVTSPSA